jgi:uncharacterized protein involved in response to NO
VTADTIHAAARRAAGPVLLARSFRPFFLAAGLWGAGALALWLAQIKGLVTLPSTLDPLAWHAHEMMLGFVMAAVAGFLLTAIPNWTGRLPVAGSGLAALVGLWVAGRIAVATSALIGPTLAALIDLALPAALIAVVVRELAAGGNWRNLPMAAALLMLMAAGAAFHGEALGLGHTAALGSRIAIATVVVLVALIGGRVVPSFTRNWLAKRGETRLPAPFGWPDKLALAATVAWAVAWTIAPVGIAATVTAGAAALANAARLARWRGERTGAEPLVWILHLGYAWLPLGLALLALGHAVPQIGQTAGIHALTAGAMGTMILAVMTRATLGHTGRTLTAGPGTLLIYLLVTAAALLRVLGAVPGSGLDMALLALSGLAWIAAFGLFVALYGPMLCTRRRDGAPE